MSRRAERAAKVTQTPHGRIWSVLTELTGNLRQIWQGYWLTPPGC